MTTWPQVEEAFDGIFARRWYTNHGPMAKALEADVAAATGRRNAVAVTNPTIGLIMMADGLGLSGDVLLSALAARRCAQSLIWAGLRPVFCDVDPDTFRLSVKTVGSRINGRTNAIMSDGSLDDPDLMALATERDLLVYSDGRCAHSMASLMDLPSCGDDAGAACILTDDDELAGRLRNIRSSYGAGRAVPVVRTANGRISEAQAAMALLSLATANHAEAQCRAYRAALARHRLLRTGSGVALIADGPVARDRIMGTLCAAGWPARRLVLGHIGVECPVAFHAANAAVLLPVGTAIDVAAVCAAIAGND